MNSAKFIENLRAYVVDSLLYESDDQFRNQMGRLVKRGIGFIGALAPILLILFVAGQILVVGKTPTFTYRGQVPQLITVLWDKLAMLAVFGCLLAVRPFLPENRPAVGRFAVAVAAVAVVIVITLDDVAAFNVGFTPASVTMVVLVVAGAVPWRPLTLLGATAASVCAWYLSITILPRLFGLPEPFANVEQIVFLIVISILSTAASALLYVVRHEEFQARRSAEDLSHSLERALNDLRIAQDRLIYIEKMASLGRFAAGVAHELRNPLNFVLNFAGLSIDLLDADEEEPGRHTPSEELRENLERIKDHAERAERIVKALVAHASQRSSHRTEVDINRLISEQVTVLSKRYEPNVSGVSVGLDVSFDEHVGELEVFPTELSFAISNVLDNAYQAAIDRARSAEDGYNPEIRLSTRRTETGVCIEIRDNGIGLSEVESGKIFEPFYTTRPAGSGIGMGLATAYSTITEGHGGRISVKSEPGTGSVFTIELDNISAGSGS